MPVHEERDLFQNEFAKRMLANFNEPKKEQYDKIMKDSKKIKDSVCGKKNGEVDETENNELVKKLELDAELYLTKLEEEEEY